MNDVTLQTITWLFIYCAIVKSDGGLYSVAVFGKGCKV
jgi:hypothetical protein